MGFWMGLRVGWGYIFVRLVCVWWCICDLCCIACVWVGGGGGRGLRVGEVIVCRVVGKLCFLCGLLCGCFLVVPAPTIVCCVN